MPGLLRITGHIELLQFWPTGEADADTTKIKVTVDANSFEYAVDRVNFSKTTVFKDAFARGTSRKKLIDNQSRVTVRLQGIDAPELHYQAAALRRDADGVTEEKRKAYNQANKVKRRQYWAETATMALAKKLEGFGADQIPCIMLSLVDHPYEVVDTYGRFVGNIRVGADLGTDINIWLAEQGWAYPTFYSSMEMEEIEAFLTAMKAAGKKNVWKAYSHDTSKFDPNLNYRGKNAVPNQAADKGPVLMPKVYRRQVAHRMEKKAKVFSGSFASFLAKKPDFCFALQDFLDNGVHSAEPHKLHEFVKGKNFTLKPHEIIFKEKPSSVVDSKGKVIKEF